MKKRPHQSVTHTNALQSHKSSGPQSHTHSQSPRDAVISFSHQHHRPHSEIYDPETRPRHHRLTLSHRHPHSLLTAHPTPRHISNSHGPTPHTQSNTPSDTQLHGSHSRSQAENPRQPHNPTQLRGHDPTQSQPHATAETDMNPHPHSPPTSRVAPTLTAAQAPHAPRAGTLHSGTR